MSRVRCGLVVAKQFKTTPESEAFGEALEIQLAGRSQKDFGYDVARVEGRDQPYSQQQVSQWIRGKEPSPDQAIAIERALPVKPGMLTRLLGYVPIDYKPPKTFDEALNLDHRLGPNERDGLRALYRSLVKAPPGQRRRSPP